MFRKFAMIAAGCIAAVSLALGAAAQGRGGHSGGGGGHFGGGGFGGGHPGGIGGGFQGAPQAPRSFAAPGYGAPSREGFRGGLQGAPQAFRGYGAQRFGAPQAGGIGGRQFRAPQNAPRIDGFNARRFGGGAAGANRFAVPRNRLGNSEGLRTRGREFRGANPPRFAREQRFGRERLGRESARGSIPQNARRDMVGKRYARNRGLERPGVPDRNAAPQFRGNELARRPFFAQRFAARGAATQALARELQPNQAFPRHGAPNNDAFRRGNGFEGHMFGDHRWRGREGRFRKFWAGGVFWPFLFGDYVSYAFWPTAYSDPFWAYGPDSILWGSLLPNSAYAEDVNAPAPQEGEAGQGQVSESYVQGPRRGRGTGERATGEQNTGEQMAAICSGFAPGIADLPLEQLERLIQPTPEQGAAFDELKAAAARASQILRSACPQETPATPVARLDAMEQRLAAMQQAVAIIRGPLEKLYAFLSDEQVQRLENAAAEPGAKDQPSMNIAQLCSGESGLTNVPEDAIAQAIKLTDEQRFDFDNLKEVSKRAGEELRTACPKEMPKSINARLEVAQKRVVALIQAIETIRPAMAVFYASLSDEQKATLNAQGGGSRSAER